MTWSDYKKPPGTDWGNPALTPSKRKFKGAIVLLDYQDMDFAVTKPAKSTAFGNPIGASDIPRDKVAQFYQDFLNKPQELNHQHSINEYWMEDSGGRYGVDLKGFGPYRMPGRSFEYGMEMQKPADCPAGANCSRDMRTDGKAAWVKDQGSQVPAGYDFVFYLSAGQDESGAWQEFGPMIYEKKEDIPASMGPPAGSGLPNWASTRYVPWTSWKAAAAPWPNAANGSSTQAESSGQAVYAHEFSHILGIGDNYNNPYANPPVRAYTGPWEMMSRGSFNGPGGPHTRWQIPPTAGASLGSHHMLRTKLKLGIIDETTVVRTDRDSLAKSGLSVVTVAARSTQPGKGQKAGYTIALPGGDKSPKCSQQTDPLCDGGGYNNYTLEVVDRMGTDSFTPDSGVLLAKTKDQDNAPFEWIVDANPQDINIVDYYKPDGTPVMITIGDHRQLSDGLFKAGTGSGSGYEFEDKANRLHFYVLDIHRDDKGVLSYTVAVKSLDGAGAQTRGVTLKNTDQCRFELGNTGSAPSGTEEQFSSDVYRLSAKDASGKQVTLPNQLATAKFGGTTTISLEATGLTLTATSESDPGKSATAVCGG
ncbi:M6 family metalloprotease domain-containing protein [Pseudonocardiaceae bacterium YIM PH 21723]|nr:M6 family metalloprotease domain-containing protein [Pseudonocardiaceae bacterium YIM PH 21723]